MRRVLQRNVLASLPCKLASLFFFHYHNSDGAVKEEEDSSIANCIYWYMI